LAVTIKDIAQRIGVSVSTVSMVLNGKDYRISPATREKVEAAAREMNYRPNRMAAGLVTKTSKTLGLIVPDITNSYFAEMAAVIEAKCADNGYSLFLCTTNYMPEHDVKYTNLLLEQGVDGILFVMSVDGHNHRAGECLQLLREAGVPILLLDQEWSNDIAVNVISNNEQGGYLAVRHLLELGHVRVGSLTGPAGTQTSQKRLSGYKRALQEYDLPFDPKLIVEGNFRTDSGYDQCDVLLAQNVTAIFAYNDMMALGIYKRLREKGIHVPEDISLVGYDNLNFTDCLEVPLTTIYQPAAQMGETAVVKMLQMLAKERPQDVIFAPKLIIRASTSPLL